MTDGLFALTSVARIASAPVDVEDRWLHPQERAICRTFPSAGRRASFLAGRWWAKRLILRHWDLSAAPSQLKIDSRGESGLGQVPTVHLGQRQLPIAVSLSHSRSFVAATVAEGRPGEWGIDLVEHDVADPTGLQAWFDAGELIEMDATQLLAGWAAKEAAHKTTCGAFRPRLLRLQPIATDVWDWQVADEKSGSCGQVRVRRSAEFCLAVARRAGLRGASSRASGCDMDGTRDSVLSVC